MAFDGIFLSHILRELDAAVGSRVEKIYLPSRDEIVLALSSRTFSGRLLISVSGVGPRLHLTDESYENPPTPPMFCMLMRKHFLSARLERVRQNGLDRTAFLEFSSYNELGDPVELTIAVELLGRQSNVVLLCNGRILDALRRSDAQSAGRLLLPGAPYEAPEMQKKLDPRGVTAAELSAAVCAAMAGGTPDRAKAICACIEGVSPTVARALDAMADESGLEPALSDWRTALGKGTPTLVTDAEGTPVDFTYFAGRTPGLSYHTCEGYSALCDRFYRQRRREETIRRRTHDLSRLTATLIERTARKIEKQRGELARCADREQLRIFGELLKANLYQVERGALFVDVVNYYDPDGNTVRIPLKPYLSPSQNAQRYFNDYRKANTAREQLTHWIGEGTAELAYLESVADELTRADSDRALAEIRAELAAAGYLRQDKNVRRKPPKALPPLRFVTDDGFSVLVGRNNQQNDLLTLRTADKRDLWFHTKSVHGTHAILITEGKEVPPSSLMQAAMLAAYHSKARQSSGVAVDYCPVRQVKKPAGARPGMVIYDGYATLYVTPDEETVERLAALAGKRE